MSISRILSLVVAGIYLVFPIAVYLCGDKEACRGLEYMLAFLVLPLACIWYGDELGELLGIKYGLVSAPSPGWAVMFMGWVILLLPLIIGIVYAVMNKL